MLGTNYSKFINGLKNKQIIMDQDIESFEVLTINSDGNSYTEVGFKTQTLVRE